MASKGEKEGREDNSTALGPQEAVPLQPKGFGQAEQLWELRHLQLHYTLGHIDATSCLAVTSGCRFWGGGRL